MYILCFSRFIKMWKHYFKKTNMPVYAWKIFLENAIEMVSIIPSNRASEAQTFRNHHHLASSHRTRWKHLVFISERVSCIHAWQTPFSVVPIHRNEMKAEQTAILCSERSKCAPVLSVCESVVTFHWCSVYLYWEWRIRYTNVLSFLIVILFTILTNQNK